MVLFVDITQLQLVMPPLWGLFFFPLDISRNLCYAGRMELKEYQTQTGNTALYPERGQNIVYPASGLATEFAEFLAVFYGDSTVVQKADEAGDVMWYMSECCHNLNIDLSGLWEATPAQDLSSTDFAAVFLRLSKLMAVPQKVMRESQDYSGSTKRRDTLRDSLVHVCSFMKAAMTASGLSLPGILNANSFKLNQRLKEGTISGAR